MLVSKASNPWGNSRGRFQDKNKEGNQEGRKIETEWSGTTRVNLSILQGHWLRKGNKCLHCSINKCSFIHSLIQYLLY